SDHRRPRFRRVGARHRMLCAFFATGQWQSFDDEVLRRKPVGSLTFCTLFRPKERALISIRELRLSSDAAVPCGDEQSLNLSSARRKAVGLITRKKSSFQVNFYET